MKHRCHIWFLSIIATYAVTGGAFAQQLPQFSQYMHNAYLLNPAAASLNSDGEVNLGYRQQWSGFDGAPLTYYINGSLNFGRQPEEDTYLWAIPVSNPELLAGQNIRRYAKHIVTAIVAEDEYGLFKRTSAMAGYAYHMPVGEKYYAGIGVSMGWYGLNFGADRVRLENPLDLTYADFIANGTRSNLFDINAGVFFYGDKLFGGYSVYQLGNNEINLGNEATPANLSQARLALHHYVMAGYSFDLSDNFRLSPSTMVKIRPPAPVSFDFNMKAEWMRKYWIGVSYRYQDAVAVLAGLTITDWLQLGYSYDYVTSNINNLSSGSHEVMLGVRFNRKK